MTETPREIAERLEYTALEFSPDELESLVNRTLAATDDVDVQSRLTFVAGMYLDRHPNAFVLSRPLVDQFLQSTNFDRLLAGLKGIQHCNASADDIVSSFLSVMKRADWEHKTAALCQLSIYLDPSSQHGKFRPAVAMETQQALQEIASSATEEYIREIALRSITRLAKLA